ncbi:MAG: adenylosuccinate lyase, partial [Crocinitomicaceae bacterium]|nr:adenylosuccinate lyase [Crocinitomicaceae bacterium]
MTEITTKPEYENPLLSRYASKEMSHIFSPDFKFRTWRKLWVALAEGEKELGIDITAEQISELKAQIQNINYADAAKQEKAVRHDVMAHVHAFGLLAPGAAGIIHLGATSCYVGDNTDLIQMKEALVLTKNKLLILIQNLSEFAIKYREMPTLGFTHYQPAQLVTVGKRSCTWIQDLLIDYQNLVFLIDSLPFRGVKGTTGTQASFLNLFEGDHEKVKKLDNIVTKKFGFTKKLTITGQTYTRKLDANVLGILSQISQSLAKFSTDIRLLQNLKEIEEPFEKSQIGSSAMAYKRNPMRSERIGSLARFVQSLEQSAVFTASTQWFERTLDDSANKRLAIPQAFLALDSMLILSNNISSGFVVNPKVIAKRVAEELPFMATENIMMECVKKGGNRQELHEVIRTHSMAAGKRVKSEGLENDLVKRMIEDPAITMTESEITSTLDAKNFIGRSIALVEEFIGEEVKPILDAETDYKSLQDDDL